MSAGDVIFNAELNTKPFDKALSKLQNTRVNWKFFNAGLKASTKQFKEAQKEALGYKKIYEDLAEQGNAFRKSMESMIGGPTLSQQEAWANLSKQIQKAKSDMEEANNFMKHAERGQKVRSLIGGIGKALGSIFGVYLKGVKGIVNGIIGAFQKLFSVLNSGVARIMALVGAVALMRKGFQNLIAVDKATADSVNQIKSSLATLGNAMASAVAPIVQAVAPAITKIINLFADATNAVAMFISALTGKKVSIVASQVSSGISGIGDSASGANDSAKELQRTLMGFDKINKLDSNKGSGSGSGGGGSGGGGGFTTVPISEDALDWADKFRESWEKADFYWLGETLANKINEALNKINWTAINDFLQRLAKSIGTALNGFIENLDWKELGKTISNGIKAGLDFAITLLDTINWEAVGNAIAKFLAGIDWLGIFKRILIDLPALLIQALVETIAGAIEGFIDEFPILKDFFSGLGEWVIDAFNLDVTASVTDIDQSKLPASKKVINGMTANTNAVKDSIAKGSKVVKSMTAQLTTPKDAIPKSKKVLSPFTAVIKSVSNGIKGGAKAVVNIAKGIFKAGGGVYKNGKWSPIQKFASGGSPNSGQLFMAREKGPELVGRIGGHTGVMNNDQIVASVSSGVAKAMMGLRVMAPQLANTQANNQIEQAQLDINQVVILMRQLLKAVNELDLNVMLDGESIKNNTVRRINNHTRATGQLELII